MLFYLLGVFTMSVFGVYILMIVCTIIVISWAITTFAYWLLFMKAGESGWKALIPIYSTYKMYDLTWKGGAYIFIFIISVAAAIISAYLNDNIISEAMCLAVLVIAIIAIVKMSKAYGHGVGFAIGLIFLPHVFLLILALGKSQYLGRQ